MTPRLLLAEATGLLRKAEVASPQLDAELLLAHALGKGRSWLIAHADDALDETAISVFNRLTERRKRREPVAYITGEKEFWSRCFHVSPDVLIPRPETEHLIEAVLDYFPDAQAPIQLCDIGTGSGCIAVTLACEYPQAHVVASDLSAAAIDVAKKNARQHAVCERMTFRTGNLFNALNPADGPFDVLVSNPPYVATEEMDALEPELSFEPRDALTDEADGLRYLVSLVEHAEEWLKPNGLLIVETGLCGLPEPTPQMHIQQPIHDLAGRLRGGVYRKVTT